MFLWGDKARSRPVATVNTGLLRTRRTPASQQVPTVSTGRPGLLGTAGPGCSGRGPAGTGATQPASRTSYLVSQTLPSQLLSHVISWRKSGKCGESRKLDWEGLRPRLLGMAWLAFLTRPQSPVRVFCPWRLPPALPLSHTVTQGCAYANPGTSALGSLSGNFRPRADSPAVSAPHPCPSHAPPLSGKQVVCSVDEHNDISRS